MSEILDVVDENDHVIGKATREEIHSSELWHRGVHVFVFDSQGKLLLPIRSSTKDKFPNTYDCSVSEHLKTGETYEEAMVKGGAHQGQSHGGDGRSAVDRGSSRYHRS